MRFLLFSLILIVSMNISAFAYHAVEGDLENVHEPIRMSVEEFERLSAVDLSEEESPIPSFEIRSFTMRNMEATFDSTRNFSGLAQRDTEILIRVLVPELMEEQDEERQDQRMLVENDMYQTHVGASGIFSQSVALSLGKNYVILYVTQGENEIVLKTIIKRKDIEIKQELEQGIALPGQTLLNRLLFLLNNASENVPE